jgi:hypothetical protein
MSSSAPEPAQDERARNVGGRPTAYRAAYAKQAKKLCTLGATDVDLAEFFEVSLSTILNWKAQHAGFLRALKPGKDVADDRVERSLYQKAIGYTFDSVKIFMPAGASEPVYAPHREHVPPDTTAAIFWLKNRRKVEWRDRHEVAIEANVTIQAVRFADVLGEVLEHVATASLPAPDGSTSGDDDGK